LRIIDVDQSGRGGIRRGRRGRRIQEEKKEQENHDGAESWF